MKIGIPAETIFGETRVAATPETIKKLVAAKHQLIVTRNAGLNANVPDTAFESAGATLGSKDEAFGADIILKVRAPSAEELKHIAPGSVLIGMLNPFDTENNNRMAAAGIQAFSLEAAPRITRAQSIDVLSSQANIAGYKAVILAANLHQRFMPMLMTAAGTVQAARVVILGAGVAGLQAIATAKRLGAIVEASDVRPNVREQIESLGAKFIDVPFESEEERDISQGIGGYARPMPAAWLARQSKLVHSRIVQADVVITTALIPGSLAPTLIAADTVKEMKPGSVIIDIAAGRGANGGGNCTLSVPDEIVNIHGVHIAGYTNLPSMVAADASSLYARNVLEFLKLITDKEGQLNIDVNDDIVAACLICLNGQVLRNA
ncbi:Re/Si-specific NAD(P)(+) transhydrogenase subunit alpha [Candidatus Pandoraea novymonadis]|uniref:proton-translocating NAD(P)(+) transhydrogenase n=1 Tax=Candidatus Pandoraea novymonadis TaxID=1808959 RepID=A0ABX5FFP1_9BURK|nr:Re/Si-specific NAD(P)(+) transhydrogenase subunit alpha [Candidatus Pandoraea novymonadis]PSB92308.1 NAD(P) transhydrogenase subunit alpha part 1 [Candidatus Pandoraea novymonadis]